jgi:hypothetical protein
MWTPEQREQDRREARLKGLRDLSSWLEDACAASRAAGVEPERKKRILVGRVRICQLFLGQPQTPVEELEQRSVDELAEQADDWQQLVEVWKKEIFLACS